MGEKTGTSIRRWLANVKIDVSATGKGYIDWIDLA
jgi:hypothetical protein